MKAFTSALSVLLLSLGLLFMPLFKGFAHAISLPQCITDSQETPFTLINSAPCGIFGGSLKTRKTTVDGSEVDVTVKYMVHTPAGTPKGLVVLFTGRVGNAGIQGNQKGGAVTSAGQNFLVRSAQLFAEEGYLAVTIDRPLRPSLEPPPTPALVPEFPTVLGFDRYRVSPKHAQDIVAVLHDLPNVVPGVDTAGLHVLLAGISRGAISAVAQNKLGIGISIQSPVTSGDTLSVGCTNRPECFPRLQPSFVKVPVHLLAHEQDGCPRSRPQDSEALHQSFLNAGVESDFDDIDGGFDLTAQTGDPCGVLAHHSFLGIETEAVEQITEALDDFLDEIEENSKPVAEPTSTSITGSTGTEVMMDLGGLASDPDGDALSFSLSHPRSSRGATLAIEGSVVTYTINETDITDGFVYIVSDGKGGVSSAVVTVLVSP